MNQYTRVYLSKLAEELSTPPINYAPSQKPITEPITVKSPDGPVTFKPYTKEKSEDSDNFIGKIQPGIYMARAYGDQLYPELAKAEAYNKEHGLSSGPTAENIQKKRTIMWDPDTDPLGGFTIPAAIGFEGAIGIGKNPAPKALQDQALDTASNEDPYRLNEDSTINHEGLHLLYDNPDKNGFARRGIDYKNFVKAFSNAEGKLPPPPRYPLMRAFQHDSNPEEQKAYLSQIQQNQFKQTGSRFDSKQWGNTLDKIFPEGQQVSDHNFEQSISQFPPDSRRMFREMKKTRETNSDQYNVIKNWQSERMPGITQNSPMTIGSRSVS